MQTSLLSKLYVNFILSDFYANFIFSKFYANFILSKFNANLLLRLGCTGTGLNVIAVKIFTCWYHPGAKPGA